MIQPTDSALLTEPLSRSDMQVIGQAVRKGWNIPDSILQRLPQALAKIVVEGKPRDKIGAARVLMQMHDSNNRPAGRGTGGPVVNVGVQVNGNPQSGRNLATQIAQRIRTERLSADASE
jgi:hypothetical protein